MALLFECPHPLCKHTINLALECHKLQESMSGYLMACPKCSSFIDWSEKGELEGPYLPYEHEYVGELSNKARIFIAIGIPGYDYVVLESYGPLVEHYVWWVESNLLDISPFDRFFWEESHWHSHIFPKCRCDSLELPRKVGLWVWEGEVGVSADCEFIRYVDIETVIEWDRWGLWPVTDGEWRPPSPEELKDVMWGQRNEDAKEQGGAVMGTE